ncbi:MAG: NAD(P)/FAD-dependent oxidoreductase, partial [Clostridia bacterium]|nr:NAD(P)/FAD-dependent oxidoreductase [Clostridia bacterium]
MNSEIAVIGGGASGLCAAIEAKRLSKKIGLDISVTVFEQLNKPAKKILATGNGRCNFSNTDINPSHYFGDKYFLNTVLASEYNDTLGFFKSLGIH